MIIRKTNIDVVHVHEEDKFCTIVRTYKKYEGVIPQFTIIYENAHAQNVEPYVTTEEGLKKMFNYDVVSLFED